MQWDSLTGETAQDQARQRILQLDLHGDSPSQLRGLIPSNDEQLPPKWKQSIKGWDCQPYHRSGKTTPAMHLALKQLLDCPYQAFTKQLYLESKCLELIALRLEQLAEVENSSVPSHHLQADDIERIHDAKAILSEQLDNPPSVPELARQVGLNHDALQQGFHQVFDTTPLGYLRDQRLERGRGLLEPRQMNIQEVATTVGYASQSRFCHAFKRKFGVTPRSYCKIPQIEPRHV
ncbi:MAG: hypothetical protein BRC51_01740 [Cyanobacteria bacterium SW_12_48_29]|nr:MAG: hypothetical protein BRC51_01740 [Cyanobacteria bacterium SW_12_48_29]